MQNQPPSNLYKFPKYKKQILKNKNKKRNINQENIEKELMSVETSSLSLETEDEKNFNFHFSSFLWFLFRVMKLNMKTIWFILKLIAHIFYQGVMCLVKFVDYASCWYAGKSQGI